MPSCSAFQCTNRTEKGFRMHRFPRDPDRRRIWEIRSQRDAKRLNRPGFLCHIHFEDSEFELHRADGKRKLKGTALPSLFPEQQRASRPKRSPGKRVIKPRNPSENVPEVVSIDHSYFSTPPPKPKQSRRARSKKASRKSVAVKREDATRGDFSSENESDFPAVKEELPQPCSTCSELRQQNSTLNLQNCKLQSELTDLKAKFVVLEKAKKPKKSVIETELAARKTTTIIIANSKSPMPEKTCMPPLHETNLLFE
ncbi:hypothetical protein CAPTEDRAFT_218190 [Capitella teleta]|uniref:THAP-type domain-containing protein n=1 Tax=Capitella teleta TaxID=283909 RepID=R7TSG5_CAPTE|nr:hypothetical protein CAPTEDRAFT_218190 [Capitella teleta]|eukprot:ELT94426.1 hypothetical protein CAPTEDRAFT_218190 [Capitella teleta]